MVLQKYKVVFQSGFLVLAMLCLNAGKAGSVYGPPVPDSAFVFPDERTSVLSASTNQDSKAKKHRFLVKMASYLGYRMPDLSPSQAYKLSQLILKLSYQYRLHPKLILSVIEVESRFQLSAISPKGALGLMQLMPATARNLAREMGLELVNDYQIFDPHTNLKIGVHYLASLRQKFSGDMKKVLSAYNRGPGKVDAELASSGALDNLKYYLKVKSRFANLNLNTL